MIRMLLVNYLRHIFHLRRLISLFILLVLLYGCKKEPFDKRNKYIGDWEFTVDETYVYNGVITYGEKYDELLVIYTEKNSIVITVDEDGNLSSHTYLAISGDISRYRVRFIVRQSHVAYGWRDDVYGEKEKWYK